jgi:hypothetical protein
VTPKPHLYFHSPCFDGIASAVLAMDFLETRSSWQGTVLCPVNYDVRAKWLTRSLETPAAVVDFLYHPKAEFWADHHISTFATQDARRDFERRREPGTVFDPNADSCAGLLWRHLSNTFGFRNRRYAELVEWADKIDAARYASVEEAIFPSTAALRISASLASSDAAEYSVFLVRQLRTASLGTVATLPEVVRRFESVQALFQRGLDRFQKAASLTSGGIVVFDVDGRGAHVSRYAPYYFFPEARDSLGVLRLDKGAKITAMRNPWRDFASVPLGKIFQKVGGGGHQRVGSVFLSEERAAKAKQLMRRLITDLREEERSIEKARPL